MKIQRWLAIAACTLAASACGGDDSKSTESTCAENVSFETVGEPFLEQHCQTCHAAGIPTASNGGHVFETEEQVRAHGRDIVEMVESGMMPPPPATLPAAEKQRFLDWLDCSGIGAQNEEHGH